MMGKHQKRSERKRECVAEEVVVMEKLLVSKKDGLKGLQIVQPKKRTEWRERGSQRERERESRLAPDPTTL